MDQESHNRLAAAKVYEVEAENKRLRRFIINSFRLICKVGQEASVLSDEAVKNRRVTR